jgi:hypothetical protein
MHSKERRFEIAVFDFVGDCKSPLLEANRPFADYRRPRDLFPFAWFFPRLFFIAVPGPRNILSGKSPSADFRNFRAARRAPSFPPWPLSLNRRVTVFPPRRKWT